MKIKNFLFLCLILIFRERLQKRRKGLVKKFSFYGDKKIIKFKLKFKLEKTLSIFSIITIYMSKF